MVICLEWGADLHMPSWCHCHSLSLASVQSRLVLPFWYRPTQVDLEKGPLNGCVCVCDGDLIEYWLMFLQKVLTILKELFLTPAFLKDAALIMQRHGKIIQLNKACHKCCYCFLLWQECLFMFSARIFFCYRPIHRLPKRETSNSWQQIFKKKFHCQIHQ